MKHKLFLIPGAGIAVVLMGVLLYGNLNRNMVYYLTPTEAVARQAEFPEGRRFRLGGQVLEGRVRVVDDAGVMFVLGDGITSVTVLHEAAPPQLFREGIGVVVEGTWSGDQFASDTMLIRHDEEYRGPDRDGVFRPAPDQETGT